MYELSLPYRAQGLEQFPQGYAWGSTTDAWRSMLMERTDEAYDCARFAYRAAEIALEREQFEDFFAPEAMRNPHLRRLNNLAGRMMCLEFQFSARWILEGTPPLDVLRQALDVWRPSREEKPQWFCDTSVLLDCVLAEQWDDASWQAAVTARRNSLRLQSANDYVRAPRGEVATLALLSEVAAGHANDHARTLCERAIAGWCDRSRDWPRNVVGLSVRERIVWFHLWQRHFTAGPTPLNEMLGELRGE
jgi:hypothetical protein